MPLVTVVCPHCGHRFTVEVKREKSKGSGAHYADRIQKLRPLHVAILEVLAQHGPLTKRRLGGLLAERGLRVSGNSLSGRLSELAGLKLIECKYTEVRLYDPKTMSFKYRKTPVWSITQAGREALARGGQLQ